jgi:hypothetical protein
MAKLEVTEALVRALVREVAPIVERLTGWQLRAEQMAVCVIPKTQAYEEIFLARLQRLSPSGDLSAFSEGIVRRLAEYVLEGTALAAYDHTNGTLYVVRENVDDSNQDGLKVIIGHELVHRGQGLYHPDLLRRTEQVAAEVLTAETISGKIEKIQEANAVMTLLEGHATLVQGVLRRLYTKAKIERHWGITALLFRSLGFLKARQYTVGAKRLAALESPKELEALYRSPGRVQELFGAASRRKKATS